MSEISQLLRELTDEQRKLFVERQVILSFGAFLDLVKEHPRRFVRNAPQYLVDCFDHFGMKKMMQGQRAYVRRFNLFDSSSERSGPIIGGEVVQDDIYTTLNGFVRQGAANKLILLHGPNGSAKSCTLEAIAHGMGRFSETEEGAVYRFNWIFPADKSINLKGSGESGPIGFGGRNEEYDNGDTSFAFYDETKIASKLHSEFKDNPLFLIPMPERERLLRRWLGASQGISPDKVEIPQHMLQSGLSKKNQLIFENLLNAYDGDLGKVFRHVQVERFFYSSQYRVGVATVEPRMSIDAVEQQLTMDKNLANLPSILTNIRFHEAYGPLIEANRGILEFSDMLKRPVEAFKYLLTTVEKGSLDLPSSTAYLDLVFFATTNEKHLDAFKSIPDFSSFRSRFHLITVPYLTRPSQEVRIYDRDVEAISKSTPVCPHTVRLLATWAVMTRIKQPDPENYPSNIRSIVSRIEPRNKVAIYDDEPLKGGFKPDEESVLREMRWKILNESRGTLVYEGRFGASPREIRALLYRAAQNPRHETLTPMAIFDELETLTRDRSVYEFLQFEPRGKYHDVAGFIETIEDDFVEVFEHEALMAMTLVSQHEYDRLLRRYVDNVVAFVKKERILNELTSAYEAPNENLMREVEKILGVTGAPERHREAMLSRVAGYKIENKSAPIDVIKVFDDYLRKIQDHYHSEKEQMIDENFRSMLVLDTDEEKDLRKEQIELARTTYSQLQSRFGYDAVSARACLKFLIQRRKRKSSGRSS
jgi:serine protein kinase